jgi:hypothetical protein
MASAHEIGMTFLTVFQPNLKKPSSALDQPSRCLPCTQFGRDPRDCLVQSQTFRSSSPDVTAGGTNWFDREPLI